MPSRSPRQPGVAPWAVGLRWVVKHILVAYLKLWHHASFEHLDRIPRHGPLLAVFNHASNLDVVGLVAIGPPDEGIVPAKVSLFDFPVLGGVLHGWGAIPVERDGRDIAGLRALLSALRHGRIVAVSVEGRRSRDGRFGSINPVVARLAVSARVPLLPLAFVGSFEALPPGAHFPRRRPVVIRVGEPFTLPPRTSTEDAALRIREAITALLPPDQQPLDVPLLAATPASLSPTP